MKPLIALALLATTGALSSCTIPPTLSPYGPTPREPAYRYARPARAPAYAAPRAYGLDGRPPPGDAQRSIDDADAAAVEASYAATVDPSYAAAVDPSYAVDGDATARDAADAVTRYDTIAAAPPDGDVRAAVTVIAPPARAPSPAEEPPPAARAATVAGPGDTRCSFGTKWKRMPI